MSLIEGARMGHYRREGLTSCGHNQGSKACENILRKVKGRHCPRCHYAVEREFTLKLRKGRLLWGK